MAKQKLGGKLIFNNPILGGISDSKYLGPANSFHKIVGLDIFSRPGVVFPSQALKAETTVDEEVIILQATNSYTYFFSRTSGKIWSRYLSITSPTYAHVHTTVPSGGAAGCLGALEYNNYIYWATATRLHRIPTGNATATTWSTGLAENWQNLNSAWHYMAEVNSVLYIADGQYVSQVDNATFTANKLQLPYGYSCSQVCKYGTDLVIAADAYGGVKYASVFVWNTYSKSFSFSDEIQDQSITELAEYDNTVLIFAAKSGNIYYLNGTKAELWYRMPFTDQPYGVALGMIYPNITVKPFCATVFRNSIFLGVTDYAQTASGVYTLGRFGPQYKKVLSMQYPLPHYDANGYPTNAIYIENVKVVDGSNRIWIFVSYKEGQTNTWKIAVTDFDNKYAKSYIDTKLIYPDNYNLTRFSYGWSDYESLDTANGAALDLKVASNHGGYGSAVTKVTDTMRSRVNFELGSIEAMVAQFRLEFTSSGNYGPKVNQWGVKID